MNIATRSLLSFAACLGWVATARAQVLFDPTLGTAPAAQGWTSVLAGATQTVSPAGVRLSTLAANAVQAGYFWNATPFDRAKGFTVSVDLQLLTETHARADRAGLSWILLSSDRKGVELAFHPDRVFAQSTTFTRSEESLVDTAVARRWDLAFLGDTYRLSSGGTTWLTGSLRDYSAFGPPYSTPNLLFIGDDTTSARADFVMGRVAVSAPEPGSAALLLCAVLLSPAFRRRHSG